MSSRAATPASTPSAMNVVTELWLGHPLPSYSTTRSWQPAVLYRAVRSLEDCGWEPGAA
ncbi:MAG: hypothetical protein JWN77_1771 [Frankiales bacterium]|jgi:hypothetical protein|nr:hypothetical protein [Frankiales bacterium]